MAGDFTVTMLDKDDYFMIGSGMAERYHQRYFNQVEMPANTVLEVMTNRIAGFNIAGPQSRALLQRLSNEELSNDSFRFMCSRRLSIAGVECVALRVSFTGDLGWELHCAENDQVALYTALLDAAAQLGGGAVGGRALGSLRIEKGYGSWGREYSTEYWPHEVGLDFLVKPDNEFLNKQAWLDIKNKEPRERLSVFEVDAVHNADASGGEPIFLPDGTPVGRVTSGAYGYSVDKSLALGFIKEGSVAAGADVDIYIIGKPHKAVLLADPVFDPQGTRLRS